MLNKQTITNILLFCLFNSVLTVSWAYPYLSEHNFREACRREVAGTFLNLHHQIEAAERNKLIYSKKINDLSKQIEIDALEIARIEKRAQTEHYLAQPESLLNEVKSRYQAAIQSKEELQILAKSTSDLLESTKSELSKIKNSLKEIFIFQIPKNSHEPITNSLKVVDPSYLQYVNQCPEYRSSCPLSVQHKKILKSAMKQTIQTGCKAYSE
ncbi:MAG: hypothetical protein KBD78_07645 [Oligoflexales bacterium]|nr:hypothetical protein [Oligoflexales bacterium]